MILARAVFQAKFGKAGDLVAALQEGIQTFSDYSEARILTDLSGPFDTVVLETQAENFAAWERSRAEMFGNPAFGASMARVSELIESGRNEFYTIES